MSENFVRLCRNEIISRLVSAAIIAECRGKENRYILLHRVLFLTFHHRGQAVIDYYKDDRSGTSLNSMLAYSYSGN